jgi:hypothetical protein
MNTEWQDLPNLQAVAKAQAEGWEIQTKPNHMSHWYLWDGKYWQSNYKYQGRPKQPKTRTVTSECWRNKQHGGLSWGNGYVSELWQRFPCGDLTGEVCDD